MTGEVVIKDVRTKRTLGKLIWQRKGTKKNGYKLAGFTIYKHKGVDDYIEKTTLSKAELYLKSLHRARAVKQVKTEYDLELFTNMFVDKHNPYILFNGEKAFTFHTDVDGQITEKRKETNKDFIALTKHNMKVEIKRNMKQFMRKHK